MKLVPGESWKDADSFKKSKRGISLDHRTWMLNNESQVFFFGWPIKV
jgi:hypothetical protein